MEAEIRSPGALSREFVQTAAHHQVEQTRGRSAGLRLHWALYSDVVKCQSHGDKYSLYYCEDIEKERSLYIKARHCRVLFI